MANLENYSSKYWPKSANQVKEFFKGNFRFYLLKLLFPSFSIYRLYNKIEKCKDCFDNGDCLQCGCDFEKLVLSDKKCNKDE